MCCRLLLASSEGEMPVCLPVIGRGDITDGRSANWLIPYGEDCNFSWLVETTGGTFVIKCLGVFLKTPGVF